MTSDRLRQTILDIAGGSLVAILLMLLLGSLTLRLEQNLVLLQPGAAMSVLLVTALGVAILGLAMIARWTLLATVALLWGAVYIVPAFVPAFEGWNTGFIDSAWIRTRATTFPYAVPGLFGAAAVFRWRRSRQSRIRDSDPSG